MLAFETVSLEQHGCQHGVWSLRRHRLGFTQPQAHCVASTAGAMPARTAVMASVNAIRCTAR